MLDKKIQIPVNSLVLKKGRKRASELGFSSINEVIRIMLHNFNKGTINLSFHEDVEFISKEYEDYLNSISKKTKNEIIKGKRGGYKDSKSFLKALNE